MSIPQDLKYTASHEWVRVDGDEWVVGITFHAQEALGDLVFVGEVDVGAQLYAGAKAGVVESVKAASDIYAPAAGEITAFNDTLEGAPELLNSDPYDNWIFRMRPADGSSLAALMDADGYANAIA